MVMQLTEAEYMTRFKKDFGNLFDSNGQPQTMIFCEKHHNQTDGFL
jgi:hypothetical protein